MSFAPSYEFIKRINEAKSEGFKVEIDQYTGSVKLVEDEYCNKILKITMHENTYGIYLRAEYPDISMKSFVQPIRKVNEDSLMKGYKESLEMLGYKGRVIFDNFTPVFILNIDDSYKKLLLYFNVYFTMFKIMDEFLMKWCRISYCQQQVSSYKPSCSSTNTSSYSSYQNYKDEAEAYSYESYRASAGWCGDEDDCPEEW